MYIYNTVYIGLTSKERDREEKTAKKNKHKENRKQSQSSRMTFWQSFRISIPILNIQSASFRGFLLYTFIHNTTSGQL